MVRLGTRGSALALTQTRFVAGLLAARFAGGDFPIATIRTEGDRDKTSPLSVIGGRGVFTSALEDALLAGEIDAAVHSAKDVPSTVPPALTIAAFPAREDQRDVLVSRHGVGLDELPAGAVIGTSSRRRAFQVRQWRPDARIVELRGNLDTRLRKALEADLDGVILAAAGIARMGWADRVTEYLLVERFVPAPGQGALAIETRALPDPAASWVAELNDPRLALAVAAERAFLRGVGAGCTSPVGAFAEVSADDRAVTLTAFLANDDGTRFERVVERFLANEAEARALELGRRVLASVSGHSSTPVTRRSSLAGCRVLVTSAGAPAERLVAALRGAGAEPLVMPLIRIRPTAHPRDLHAAVGRIVANEYGWIAITSGNAVSALVEAMGEHGDDALPAGVRIAAVGQATARRLREAGFAVALVPEQQDAAGLVAAFRTQGVEGQRVICLLGNLARPVLADGLRGLGAEVDVVEAYRTEPVAAIPDEVRARVQRGVIDVVTFASPSAVETWVRLFAGVCQPEPIVAACLGPTTRDAAVAHGFAPVIVAAEPSAGALVAAIAHHVTADANGVAQ